MEISECCQDMHDSYLTNLTLPNHAWPARSSWCIHLTRAMKQAEDQDGLPASSILASAQAFWLKWLQSDAHGLLPD